MEKAPNTVTLDLDDTRSRKKDFRYQSIFEASRDGLVITDELGTIVEANSAACEMHGCSYDQFVGQHVTRFIPPELRGAFAESVRDLRPGDTIEAQREVMRYDGSRFHVDVRISAFLQDGKLHRMASLRDVTESMKATVELREKEEQYRRIFEASSDGLIINDPARGVVVEANPAVCRMHGYTYEEFVGLHGTDFIHPDYHPVFADFLETIMAGGTYQTQATDIRKDGTAFPVEVHGSLLTYKGRPHILAVVRDITERVRAYELLEQRVEERTRELSTLLKVSHHVVSSLELEPLLAIIFDQLETVIDYADSSIFALEGEDLRIIGNRGPLPSEEIHVRFPVIHIGPSEPIVKHGKTVIIDDVQGDSREAREFREAVGAPLGSVGIRSWMGVPMRVGERVIGALSVANTEPGYYTQHHAALVLAIAQQAALAVENARLYEEAQDVAVLEERQRLARELHDSVSQALYGIVLGSQTARALLPRQPERVAEPLEYVLSQAEAALADMRALIFELRPEVLEQEGLVSALEKRVAVMCARHNLAVHTELAEEPDVPFSVKEAVYRIAQEALHNIIKHARAHRVEVDLGWDGRTLTLGIGDDGSGFDPGGSFPGHFGLKTMRERVARLGGTFSIDSTVGHGTRISVTIPVG